MGTTKISLGDDLFEQRWTWLRSYATWKSAMGVYLYPENVASPTLLRERSRPLGDAINRTRNTTTTPEDADEIVEEYAEYFRDVTTVTVEATCWMEAGRNADDAASLTERERQFLFGRGGDVNENVEQSVYWSVHDPTGATDQERASGEPSDFESGSRQTFWQKVPHVEKVSEIVGSAAYGGRIYLFLKRRRDGAVRAYYEI